MSKCTIFFIIIFLLPLAIQAQLAEVKKERFIPFKYSSNDAPFTIGGGLATGLGSLGPSVGVMLESDIYHIYLCGRAVEYGFPPFDDLKVSESALLFGYQFRLPGIMSHIGFGFGKQKYLCTSGIGGNCTNIREETISSTAFKLGVDVLLSSYAAVGVSFNSSTSSRSNANAVLIGMKFGYFGKKKVVKEE